MSPLRTQFIGLLTLRGYAQRTHESYIRAVAALSRHYGLPPDQLNDGQIRDYLMGLHREGLSRSTINAAIWLQGLSRGVTAQSHEPGT